MAQFDRKGWHGLTEIAIQKDKNEQLTYLQAKLLPELIKAEETGVSGLKASLDRFARVATNVSDNVLTAANQAGENLALQKEVMDKVDNMKVLKISRWNLELFDKLENNMDAINRFSTYLSSMEHIANKLSEFAAKTSDIDRVINNIDSTLGESKDLTRFLASHIDEIQNSGDAALKSVGIAESHFEKAIKSLQERTDEMMNNLYRNSGNHESHLENIYHEIEKNLNSITTQYVDAFKAAFTDSMPRLNQLDNLELIKDINVSSKNYLNQNKELISRLSSIEENIKKRKSRNNSSINEYVVSNEKVKKADESIGIGKVIKKVF